MYCYFCGSKMDLDDKDFVKKGTFDKYWYCEKCNASCIEEYKSFKLVSINWHLENDKICIDKIFNF